jgi:hypothetical protein
MIAIEYPKIETLYDRDPATFKVDVNKVRWPAFDNIKRWHVTEKVDGTNVRVALHADGGIEFGGRGGESQFPKELLAYLNRTFTQELMHPVFRSKDGMYPEVILFGEGYGAKIQKGGGNYRGDVSFRLFDCKIGDWWLEPENVQGIASTLGLAICPPLAVIDFLPKSPDNLDTILGHGGMSLAAEQDGGAGLRAEGIVARSIPLLFGRNGARIMWKLKYKDF